MTEESLFKAALAKSAAERSAFLEAACAEQPMLRAVVEARLAAHESQSGLHGHTVESSVATGEYTPDADGGEPAQIFDGCNPEAAGSVIAGRYKLMKVIGEGGMGSVYLASQSEPVKRQVALKLIKPGMDSKAVLARFNAERQALALMDHPNIARIYDGGVTPSGQPFFVMELVHGVPITKYCDQQRLSVDARLQLFVLVCQAVQHAHQKGIIHRDLKPSNVLVTDVDGRPSPKVIDFGVAKATEFKLTDQSFADVGAVVGTPTYMSPEQADPTTMDIDTRTDVYALGVMLYELLVGSPPIDAAQFKRGAILEMLRMVRDEEPPRPSTKLSTADALPNIAANRAIEPSKLTKLLRGELDWVVMKALEKDRTRRYETANGFARDIERYLADEVVEARPPSTGYRLRKFVRRHMSQVIAASVIFLALIGGIVGTSLGLFRALAAEKLASDRLEQVEKARDATAKALGESEVARKQATAVGEFLVNAFQKPQPEMDGRQLKVVDLLEKAADKLAADKEMPELTRARLQTELGETFFRLGLSEKAVLLQQDASATYRRNLGDNDPQTLDAMHRLSYSLAHAHRYDEAIRIGEATLARMKTVHGPQHINTLLVMSQLANRYMDVNRMDLAIPLAAEALTAQRQLTGAGREWVPNSIANLAQMYKIVGRNAESVKLYEEAMAMYKTAHPAGHPDALAVIAKLGQAYRAAGRMADAIAIQRETAAQIEETMGSDHPRTLGVLSQLVRTYVEAGKADEALPVSEKALTLAKNAKTPNPVAVQQAMEDLALTYSYLNRTKESLALLQEVVASATTQHGPNSEATRHALYNLANAYRRANQLVEAIAAFEKVYAIEKMTVPEDDRNHMITMTQLASAYEAAGRAQEAIPILEPLLVRQKVKLDPDHRDVMLTTFILGRSYGSVGRTGDAVRTLEQAAAAFKKKYGVTHPDARGVIIVLGTAYMKDNQFEPAESTIRDLLTAMRPTLPADSSELAKILAALGEILLGAKKFPEAEVALRECQTIRDKKEPASLTTFISKSMLGAALLAQKKHADAEPLLLAGYEGLKKQGAKLPPQGKVRLTEAIERLVQLYEAQEKKDEAAKWRQELDESKATQKPGNKP